MSENTPENSGVRRPSLDTPMRARARLLPQFRPNPDAFGEATEGMARFMGTPQFILWMTLFCAFWLIWNTTAPVDWRFDDAAIGFTALTLMLSLQASYAAPLLLLAQNRQDDRDRVQAEQDRQSNERNHATTDFITREIASLRLALNDVATRDFVRGELRGVQEDLRDEVREALRAELRDQIREELRAELRAGGDAGSGPGSGAAPEQRPRKQKKHKGRDRGRDERRQGEDGVDPSTTTLAVIAAREAAEAAGQDTGRPQADGRDGERR